MAEPYIKVVAGDIIKSSDWNSIQVQIRSDLAKLDQKIDSLGAAFDQKLGQLNATLEQEISDLRTSTSSRLDALVSSLGASLTTKTLAVSGALTANRYGGVNALPLADYTTLDPESNVYLDSPPNDRDAWIYRDAADHTSNWGMYHRQIDTPVKGLPANSIGFVGGGHSALQAYVNLQSGDGYFAGRLSVASLAIGQWTLTEDGNHLYLRRGAAVVARFSIEHDRLRVFRYLDGNTPYFFYNEDGRII